MASIHLVSGKKVPSRLDFTGTCNSFAHNEDLDFAGIFLDFTGTGASRRPYIIRCLERLSTGL
jgi:hypothetical protein